MITIKLLAVIALGVAFTLIGDVFLKRSNGFERPWDLALGVLLYSATCVPVLWAFKRAEFGSVFILWESLALIFAILVGRLVFQEPITTTRAFAALFALIALFLSTR
jgi:multidrug transporter EmrE-like cation transporter